MTAVENWTVRHLLKDTIPPIEGVEDVPGGTVSACRKNLHPGDATKWGDLLRLNYWLRGLADAPKRSTGFI